MRKYLLYSIINIVMCFNLYATDFGTKEEAENMLERAVNILKLDKSLALELFAEGEGGFIYKDLYTLCYHIDSGTMYSHPTLTGLSREKSVSEGVNIADLIVKNASEGKVNSIMLKCQDLLLEILKYLIKLFSYQSGRFSLCSRFL